MSCIPNRIDLTLRGNIKVTGLPEEIPWATKFPEAVTKFDNCSSLHEMMPVVANMIELLDQFGYRVVSTNSVSGIHPHGESFIMWNLAIP